jgi:hypothetical protein
MCIPHTTASSDMNCLWFSPVAHKIYNYAYHVSLEHGCTVLSGELCNEKTIVTYHNNLQLLHYEEEIIILF